MAIRESKNPLTALRVKNLTERGYYGDGGGLYLKVGESGGKSWVYRYQYAKKRHDMGLGGHPPITLSQAREKAHEIREQIDKGINPILHKRANLLAGEKAVTFRTAAAQYIANKKHEWRGERSRLQWESNLENIINPVIGDIPVQLIDQNQVLKILEPIWHTKTETASRVRQRIEKIMDYCKARGYCTTENPARWKAHLDLILPKPSKTKTKLREMTGKGEHHPALNYRDLGVFMPDLRGKDGISAQCLQWVIMTATRTTETIMATWGEIDMDAMTWIIPAKRMKAKREHRIPLSDQMTAFLKTLPQGAPDELIFQNPTGRPLSNMALLMLLRRMGYKTREGKAITAHGFRSTFRDWAGEQTHHAREIIEHAIAHSVGGKTEQAYSRGDLLEKRRILMRDWCEYLSREGKQGKIHQLLRA